MIGVQLVESGRRIAAHVAAIVALVALTPIAPAQAGCSPDDLLNALENTVGSVSSSACATACSDGAGCVAAGVVAAALGGMSADASQGTVDQFCSAVQNILNNVTTGGDDASTVVKLLNQVDPSLSQALQKQISDGVSAVASPLAVAACGCSLEQSLGQLDSAVGACIQDALCALDDLIGNPCTCTPPPPIAANCALPPGSCGWSDKNPACQGEGTILKGPSGYTPVNQVDGAGGTFVSTGGNSSDGQGHCSAVSFCFCPKPMIPTWVPDSARDINGQFSIFVCACPSGTHLAGAAGGSPVCLCDKTNQAPQPPDSFTGMCPPPGCPKGQVSSGGKCITPCSDPTQVLLADGHCCNPSQATSCGTCCPAGQTPDPATGSCVALRPTPIRVPPRLGPL